MTDQTRTVELLGEIDRARALVAAALATTSSGWDETPEPGEWSVRRIAQHVVENDYFFGGEVARLLGQAAPSPASTEYATPGGAVDALADSGRAVRPALNAVSDGDLALDWQGGMSLADLLAFYAEHTMEHVAQIEATRGTLALAS